MEFWGIAVLRETDPDFWGMLLLFAVDLLSFIAISICLP